MRTSFNPTQILLSSDICINEYFTKTNLGSADILHLLFPQLEVKERPTCKSWNKLTQVDFYMLEETHELCKRIKSLCKQAGLDDYSNLKIRPSQHGWEISPVKSNFTLVSKLINEDKWIKSALDWLYPNYVLLANSVELVTFSKLYQYKGRAAVDQYQHFDGHNNGLTFYIGFHQGEVKPIVESPVNLFTI